MTGQEKAFLIGIGGMGMGPLAVYLAQAGWKLAGQDDGLQEPVQRVLESQGIAPAEYADIPDGFPLVAFSSAVAPGHPLRQAASAKKLRLLRRGELLAETVADRKLVAVVGSHGKTTTTGMLVHALDAAGFPFGYILGGLFAETARLPARYTDQSPWVVAEIDESDGTINRFSPEVTVAVNFDWDHPDYYKTPQELEATFAALFARTRGAVFIPAGCEVLGRLARESAKCPVFTFGFGGDYRAEILMQAQGMARLKLEGRFDPRVVNLRVGGKFNAINAQAALGVTHYICGRLSTDDCLGCFRGIRRRQDVLVRKPGLSVVADYAHHPTEISALLDFGRACFPGRQIAIFQPHRYTRTRQYAKDFAATLSRADLTLLLPVYAASEPVIAEGTTAAIARAWPADPDRLRVLEDPADLPRALREAVPNGSPETVVLFIGAGDIDQMAARYAAEVMPQHQADPAEKFATEVQALLSGPGILKRDEPLAEKTTMRVGGPARFYAEPANVDDLAALLRTAERFGLPQFILGRGSNLLVPDEGFPGLVLRLDAPGFKQITPLEGGRLRAGAGVRLKELCGHAAALGLAGFEFLEGIPGSVGGSLRMNAGAMGGWIFDVIEEVELVTLDGVLRRVPRDAFHVGYRKCQELLEAVAVSAVFRAPSQDETAAIRARMDEFSGKRKSSQPRDPSAGCVFKNPEGTFAGKLIDELGLKGRRVGAAEVSPIHGNFIVNKGGATCADILALIRDIRREVKGARGIELEPEVLLLGKTWEQVL